MTVPAIDPIQIGATSQPVRAPKQTMDSEVFMHLLVTQLANQDPSSPMDTNEMIAQTTQLASMERLNALGDTQNAALAMQQRAAAASLMGQEITTSGDQPKTGIVTAISFAGVEPTVTIGDSQIPYSQIASIRAAGAPAETTDPTPVPAEPDPTTPDPAPAASV